jgi:hypothetical protein
VATQHQNSPKKPLRVAVEKQGRESGLAQTYVPRLGDMAKLYWCVDKSRSVFTRNVDKTSTK